jgi:hypothetical protein
MKVDWWRWRWQSRSAGWRERERGWSRNNIFLFFILLGSDLYFRSTTPIDFAFISKIIIIIIIKILKQVCFTQRNFEKTQCLVFFFKKKKSFG